MFAFYYDLYRELLVELTYDSDYALTTVYRYESLSFPSSNRLTYPVSSDRMFMSMYNTALSVNGITAPSSVLSPMFFDFRGADGSSLAELESVSCRIYGCYVLDGFDWRHYMIPCLRVSDGREGLYDVVDGVFSAILIPNTITNESGTMTATYPVASDLTVTLSRNGISGGSVTFPKGTSSVSLGSAYRYYSVSTITPSVDDLYYYVAGTY